VVLAAIQAGLPHAAVPSCHQPVSGPR
jgi:hypothetical protein